MIQLFRAFNIYLFKFEPQILHSVIRRIVIHSYTRIHFGGGVESSLLHLCIVKRIRVYVYMYRTFFLPSDYQIHSILVTLRVQTFIS